MFKLSERSLRRLKGVDARLVNAVKYAITVSTVDFGVSEGVRTLQRQKQLLKMKKTKTLNSKHITGKAVDLLAYYDVDGDGDLEACWEIDLYDDIADAMRKAAIKYNLKIRWGGAWTVPSIKDWKGKMRKAYLSYIDKRRSQGRTPFIDGPHFEIS